MDYSCHNNRDLLSPFHSEITSPLPKDSTRSDKGEVWLTALVDRIEHRAVPIRPILQKSQSHSIVDNCYQVSVSAFQRLL